jgi:glutamine synthetase
VSIRDGSGDNIFAIKPEELNGGREGAAYDELKYISQTAEYFLAGVLHGLTDVMPTVSASLIEVFDLIPNSMTARTNHQRL